MHFRHVSILGLGLLGASLGLALRKHASGTRIMGYAHRGATARAALKRGAADEVFENPVEAIRGADLVVLCTPVGTFAEILKQIAPSLEDGAIVTDVGSTKRSVVQLGEKLLPPTSHFVGSHPMAGSEKRGVEFARADLYDGALCIVTPTAATNGAALTKVDEFWKSVGMRTTHIDPVAHDRLLASVSHLPHAIAAALTAVQPEAALPLAGKGFLDSTRVAAGDAGLWRDIFLDNRDNLAKSLAEVRGEIDRLTAMLASGDAAAVETWLAKAAAKRGQMNK